LTRRWTARFFCGWRSGEGRGICHSFAIIAQFFTRFFLGVMRAVCIAKGKGELARCLLIDQ